MKKERQGRFFFILQPSSFILCFLLTGTFGSAALPAELDAKVEASLAAAARFLAGRQDEDGAWRSKVYGPFKDGPTLTPHVLLALNCLPEGGPEARRSFDRGVKYLKSLIDEQGQLRGPLVMPVYTSAGACMVVPQEAQRAWVDQLRAHQLTAALGWDESDSSFGGWGYSISPPHKPNGTANLSATLYGVTALRNAGVPLDDAAYAQILTFVSRCQNFPHDPANRDARFDDGGFFFTPHDAAKNKAGVAGTDREGRERYHSYGSMTADGVRTLILCGAKHEDPRIVAARQWLEQNFSATENPGTFAPDREMIRRSTYFYYCWSVAHALRELNLTDLDTRRGKVHWPEALATELLARQRPDGSWSNDFTDTKEDDPLIATPHAAIALYICRRVNLDGQNGK